MYDSTKPYIKQILELIKQTWTTPCVVVKDGNVEKKFYCKEYHHTDGIGTKGVYHWQQKSFRNAVLDALAMNLNDLAMERAWPYAIVDHLMIPKDDNDAILEIMENLSKECRIRGIAITGGETAVHDNMEGMELSITMLGFVQKPKTNKLEIGDVLIGIESNGLHSNGFTKIRELFDNYRNEFIEPTHIYLNEIFGLNEKYDVHGMMHITGGAFTKLKSLLEGIDVVINDSHKLEPQKIFQEIYNKIGDEEIYRTFNCGVGFVLGVKETDVKNCLKEIKGLKADVIGKVINGTGKVRIKSKFSDKEIIY